MATVIHFGGTNRTNNVRQIASGYRINAEVGTVGTASFQVVGRSAGYIPSIGERVRVWRDGKLRFSGYVQRVRRKFDRTDRVAQAYYSEIEAVDEMQLLLWNLTEERDWSNTAAGEIIRQIFAGPMNGNGIDYQQVQDGPVIPYVNFIYLQVQEAVRDLAQRAGFVFWLNYDREAYFGPKLERISDYAPATSANNFEDAELTIDQQQYGNRFLVRVAESIREVETQTFTATANQQEFELDFPCYQAPEIREAGVDQPVEIDGNGGAAYYWTQDGRTIRRDETRPPLAAGTLVEITYVGLENIYVGDQDLGEIGARATLEQGSGLHFVFEDVAGRVTRQAAAQYVAAKLAELRQVSETLIINTNASLDAACEDVRPGDAITVNIPQAPAVGTFAVQAVSFDRLPLLDDGIAVHRVSITAVRGGPRLTAVEFLRQWREGGAGGSRSSIEGGGGAATQLGYSAIAGTGPFAVNLNAFQAFEFTLEGDAAEITAPAGGYSSQPFTVTIKQDATGGYAPAWAAEYVGVAAAPPAVGPGEQTHYSFIRRPDGSAILSMFFVGVAE